MFGCWCNTIGITYPLLQGIGGIYRGYGSSFPTSCWDVGRCVPDGIVGVTTSLFFVAAPVFPNEWFGPYVGLSLGSTLCCEFAGSFRWFDHVVAPNVYLIYIYYCVTYIIG